MKTKQLGTNVMAIFQKDTDARVSNYLVFTGNLNDAQDSFFAHFLGDCI